ncbi:hypothetical protein C4K38_0742 [Pseudomonas chlororaphis subsp. piscium]|nr:hypothetical protein C4K38_0742 [Pseudomonas chlororaphis subsp. piscium]
MISSLQALPYRRLAQPCTGYPQLAPQYLCASPKVGHKHCVAFF